MSKTKTQAAVRTRSSRKLAGSKVCRPKHGWSKERKNRHKQQAEKEASALEHGIIDEWAGLPIRLSCPYPEGCSYCKSEGRV